MLLLAALQIQQAATRLCRALGPPCVCPLEAKGFTLSNEKWKSEKRVAVSVSVGKGQAIRMISGVMVCVCVCNMVCVCVCVCVYICCVCMR